MGTINQIFYRGEIMKIEFGKTQVCYNGHMWTIIGEESGQLVLLKNNDIIYVPINQIFYRGEIMRHIHNK